ncbi:hypothetical protein WDU94_014739 [Cyamophila willieti]
MDKNKGKFEVQVNHPKAKKNHETKQTTPKSIRGPIPSPRQSQTPQTLKSKTVIKPLVEKFDKDSIQGTKSILTYKSRESRVNMKNLGRRYFTQLKKNALENKRMLSEPQDKDLNLIKEQVSVRQIKKVFIQNSMSSNMLGNRKSFIRQQKSTEMACKYTSANSPFLMELLESVKKKNSPFKNTLNSNSLTCDSDNIVTEPLKSLQDSEQDDLTLEKNKSISLILMNQPTVTTFHLQTDDHTVKSKQNKIDNEVSGENSSDVFQPQSYTFRVTSNTPMTNCPVTARPPPFWALLDNFIAVIWGLLNHETIGIHQLQWTYELLKVMKYKNGLFPDIVEEFLEKIQDKLIFSYAEFYEMKEKNKEKSSSNVLEERKEDKLNMIARNIAKKNKWVDRKALMKSFSLQEIIKQGTNSICKPTEADKLIIKSLIPKATQEHRTKSTQPQQAEYTECDANICHLNEKQKEEIKALLCRMKNEQTEKIQKELSKIQKIETLMSHIDGNFVPSIDYESAQVAFNNMKNCTTNETK